MGGLLDAMKSAGLATDEQIKKVEREKAEKARLDTERREAKAVKRRERELNHPLLDFIRQAIKERHDQVEIYITRVEEQMGTFPPEIREQLFRVPPSEALKMLVATLTLFLILLDKEPEEETTRDEIVKRVREIAMTPLVNTLLENAG